MNDESAEKYLEATIRQQPRHWLIDKKAKRQTSPPSRPKEIALSLFVHMSRLVIY